MVAHEPSAPTWQQRQAGQHHLAEKGLGLGFKVLGLGFKDLGFRVKGSRV